MTVTAMPIEPDRHLAALARLAEAIPHEGWFSACGDPLIAAEREEARLYLDGLGFADTRVQAVPDWVAARAVAERVLDAFSLVDTAPDLPPLIHERIG